MAPALRFRPRERIAQPHPVGFLSYRRALLAVCLTAGALLVTACGGGGGGGGSTTTPSGPAPLSGTARPTTMDATRFLAQSTFGPTSPQDVTALQDRGYDSWLAEQFTLPAASHVDYIKAALPRTMDGRATEEMSYEAVWQQWLTGREQLRARVVFALSEIMVISNIAPDLNPWAMSSYMDMLNRDAFGNYRTLLEDVTLHPAMGHYLNMLQSEKEDPSIGRNPNENYAREVMQLFSIGLVKLNADGTPQLDGSGKPIPTYDQAVVSGFAKAYSGWSFGGQNTSDDGAFYNNDGNWLIPMQAWPGKHSTAAKKLLDGKLLPAGQSAQQDMKDALDTIFNHPNVAPFISRRLIQRLVTSNPSPAYVGRVAAVFSNNGSGVRGDLKAVVRAVLLDAEARDESKMTDAKWGKQREPVIRFANFLRGLNAKSTSGRNDIHDLDSADSALGQSPLLSPSVFNFFSPDYRSPGAVAQAGLYSPEFQITTETSVVGALNFFSNLVNQGSYGNAENELKLDYAPLEAMATDPNKLADHVSLMFMNNAMTAANRATFVKAIGAIPANQKTDRVKAALILTAISPDFVIQK